MVIEILITSFPLPSSSTLQQPELSSSPLFPSPSIMHAIEIYPFLEVCVQPFAFLAPLWPRILNLFSQLVVCNLRPLVW